MKLFTTQQLKKVLRRTFHVLCWTLLVLFIGCVILIGWAAYGVPGHWVEDYINDQLPEDFGYATIDWIAYRPGRGFVVEKFTLHEKETERILVRFSKAKIDFALFNFKPISKRIEAVDIEDFYAAQLEYKDKFDDPRERYQPRFEFFDFKSLNFYCDPFPVTLKRVHILDMSAEEIRATVHANGQKLFIKQLETRVDSSSQLKGDVVFDFKQQWMDVSLSGELHHTNVLGIYRAIDFPLLEEYSNKFRINRNLLAHLEMRVGLDKYDNLFSMKLKLDVPTAGAYCGVPFDEASCVITSDGVWDTITEISDLTIMRNGRQVASGQLCFSCPANAFSFEVETTGIQLNESLQLLEMEFTKSIPPMECERPPEFRLSGRLPLLTTPSVNDVVIENGTFKSNGKFSIYNDYHVNSIVTDFSMVNGTFKLSNLYAEVGETQKEMLLGGAKIIIPENGEYVDIWVDFATSGLALKDISEKWSTLFGEDAMCEGVGEVYCRTDEKLLETLWANFDLKVTGKKLARLPYFSILTDWLANNIITVSNITDVNEIHAKGHIRNGIINIERARVEGSLLSIEGPVQYNLLNEETKASLIVGFINEDSYLGKFTHHTFLPIARTMWQVHVSGKGNDFEFDHQTILGAVTNFVTGNQGQLSTLQKETIRLQDERSSNEEKNDVEPFTNLFYEE